MHDSLLKLRQFHLSQFASVYSASNEWQHRLESTCDGPASCPGESVQLHSNCLSSMKPVWPPLSFVAYLRHTVWWMNLPTLPMVQYFPIPGGNRVLARFNIYIHAIRTYVLYRDSIALTSCPQWCAASFPTRAHPNSTDSILINTVMVLLS